MPIDKSIPIFRLDKLLSKRHEIQQKDILTPEDEEALNKIELMLDVCEEDPKIFFDDKEFIPKRLGDYLMLSDSFKTVMGSEEVYCYKDGIYVNEGKELIRTRTAHILGEEYKSHYANETVSYIQARTYIHPNLINNNWLNLENGLLNPMTTEFRSHTPEIFTISRIPIFYDPKADCPLWKKSLMERVEKSIFLTVQEAFGYCFLPGQKYEKGFLLHGQKRTFKSTTLYILEGIIGRDNITAFSLQEFSNDKFASAYIYGKTANICGDINSKSLYDTGSFLKITGGDPITSSKKNKDYVTFYPSTKLIFSCNVIPATTNKNPAFYRRWIILPFHVQTPADKVDPNFREKLRAELPGILNWSLEGLRRLEDQGRFSYELSEDEVKDMYEKNSDTVQSFIFNCIDMENDEGSLTKREVFSSYLEYCKSNELQPVNIFLFGRSFLGLTGCGTGKKGTGENSIPAYKGVNWKVKEVKGIEKFIINENINNNSYGNI